MAKNIFTSFTIFMDYKNSISTQNFNGIYKLKNSNDEVLKIVEDSVVPLYQALKTRPVLLFKGDNPAEFSLINSMSSLLKKEGTSYSWLLQNAKIHGVKFPDDVNGDIWVMTGKDVVLAQDVVDETIKKFEKGSFLFTLKFVKNLLWGKFKNVPEHLRDYLYVLEKNKTITTLFDNKIKNKNVELVEDVEDLAYKMLKE